ncbi:TRP-domain-containing protein [Sanghuangporus baumii]|uniref:TRP-domain-containing protein n=1 Tax=Sanghuangporus baumii TaxID=108892 RepID=A0A9Q5NA29_SANBA|nr:TRP-domain-containing protein [Sanghuangporus baumii]
MLFPVAARLQRYAAIAFACFACTSLVDAKEEVLFTSSVSYCEPPQLILVQQFDVMYFVKNESVFFNISAASVEENVNVTANLMLNVYGTHSINITLDLCSLLNGALCPLPTYNFIGSETISIKSLGLDLANRISGIAYKIPDLEAFAQLTLTRVDTGEVKACVQSTLSNGWSTRQLAVEWVTGCLAIFAFVSALLSTLLSSPSLAPQRLIDLMLLFQTIVASALLDLNYPVLYRAFATNFSWALGLFGSTEESSIQNAIDNMRHHTGGDMSDATGGDGVELVNRKLSPYNVATVTTAETLEAIKNLQQKIAAHQQLIANGTSELNELLRRDTTVTVTESNVLNAGIPVYVNSLGISTANAFMSIFFTLLMLVAIVLFVFGMGWLFLFFVTKRKEKRGRDAGKLEEWKQGYAGFCKSWALRLILIVFLPIMIFSMHQWTLKDSWLATLFSVLTFLVILFYVLYPSFLTIRLAKRSRPDALYEELQHRVSFGVFHAAYRPPRWWFFTIPVTVLFIKAIVTAFGYASGLVQLILILIIEIFLFISIIVFKPHPTRGADILASTLSIGRILITALTFAFVESFEVAAIPRVGVGIAAAVVASLCVILMFFNIIVNFSLWALWREHLSARLGTRLGSTLRLGHWGRVSAPGSARGSANNSVIDEKDKEADSAAAELGASRLRGGAGAASFYDERPSNPTPDQHQPFDTTMNSPCPSITPTTASSNKMFQRNSDFRVSYASSQMPSTGTTFDSFGAASSSTETTFGRELPRSPKYEGLGFERLVDELGTSELPSTSSAPSTPQSQSQSHSRKGSKMETWVPSVALPRMSESAEESLCDDRRGSPPKT